MESWNPTSKLAVFPGYFGNFDNMLTFIMNSLPIIQKPVNYFAWEINWLITIKWECWLLKKFEVLKFFTSFNQALRKKRKKREKEEKVGLKDYFQVYQRGDWSIACQDIRIRHFAQLFTTWFDKIKNWIFYWIGKKNIFHMIVHLQGFR